MRSSSHQLSAILVLVLSTFAWGARPAPTGDEHKNLDQLPDTKLKIKCPSGHAQIKVIPGWRAFPTSCGKLPDETEICAECKYIYDRDHGFWEREGENTEDFSVPLSSIVASLPVPKKAMQSREPSYQQYWKEGEVRREYVVCRSNEHFPAVAQRVKDYLVQNQIEISHAQQSPERLTLHTKWKDYQLDVEVVYVKEYRDTYCRIELATGKSIWELDKLEMKGSP